MKQSLFLTEAVKLLCNFAENEFTTDTVLAILKSKTVLLNMNIVKLENMVSLFKKIK